MSPRHAQELKLHRYVRTHAPSPAIWGVLRWLFHLLNRLLRAVEYHHLERIPVQGPVIVAANHASYFDQFLVGLGMPRNSYFMVMGELFQWPLVAWFLSRGGGFPVHRGKRDEAAMVTGETILRNRHPLIVFPTGRHRRPEEPPWGANPKPGIGRLGAIEDTQVVPVALIDNHRWSPYPRLPLHKVKVVVGEPMRMPASQGLGRDREAQQRFADQVLAEISRLYQQDLPEPPRS